MRKSLLALVLAVALAGGTATEARTLSPAEALARFTAAQGTGPSRAAALNSKSSLTLRQAISAKDAAEPSLYIFEGDAENGFIVTAADDAFPAVIGYSGYSYNPDSIPDGLKWYLETVAQNVDAVRRGAVTYESTSYRDNWESLDIICKSVWHQSSPYNGKLSTGISPSYTAKKVGCVAIAIGQIMFHHKHPARGTGSNTYQFTVDSKTYTNTRDFSSHEYLWDGSHIIRDLQKTSSDQQKESTGTFLADAGCAVEMIYKSSSSTSQTIRAVYALTEYFGYSKDMRYYWQGLGLSQEEWETEIYNSLKNGRPVLYGGCSADSGHAFVCDGYKADGTFHINWGWGWRDPRETTDFYSLSSLVPVSSKEGKHYKYHQLIVTNIHPATEGETCQLQAPVIGFFGNLKYGTYSSKKYCFYAQDEDTQKDDGSYRDDGFLNLSPDKLNIEYGIIIQDIVSKKMYLIHKEAAQEYAPKGSKKYIQLPLDELKQTLPGVLPRSRYTVHIAYHIVEDGANSAPAKAPATASDYEVPEGWNIATAPTDGSATINAWMNILNPGEGDNIEVSLNEGGLITGILDIASDTDNTAIRQIVRPDGTVVAVNPTDAEIENLPHGLYIFVTPAGSRKVLR